MCAWCGCVRVHGVCVCVCVCVGVCVCVCVGNVIAGNKVTIEEGKKHKDEKIRG